MSYEIVYERQFLKVQLPSCDIPWIIPLALHGSNNCTEYSYSGRERRERNWGAIYFNGRNQIPVEAPKIIMEKVESFCGGEYQEHFKRNGKWVDDAVLRRYFENGIKDAKTLEELNEISQTRVSLKCHLSIWEGHNNRSDLQRNVYNSAELVQFILDAKLRIRNRIEREEIYVCIGFPEDKAVPYPKAEFKIQRKPKEFEKEYWVLASIKYGSNVYVEQLTSRNLRYTYSKERARKFATEKEALKWIETKLKTRGFNKSVIESLVPERVEL